MDGGLGKRYLNLNFSYFTYRKSVALQFGVFHFYVLKDQPTTWAYFLLYNNRNAIWFIIVWRLIQYLLKKYTFYTHIIDRERDQYFTGEKYNEAFFQYVK